MRLPRLQQIITQHLHRLGVTYVEMSPAERPRVGALWLAAFADGVRESRGVDVIGEYRWHGFSYGIEPCVQGSAALEEYARQQAAPYYVFDERMFFCLKCESDAYLDLSDLRDDLYVAHHKMKWTMAFTHEQPEIGPFFATRGAAPKHYRTDQRKP